jgi:hypothetical protein
VLRWRQARRQSIVLVDAGPRAGGHRFVLASAAAGSGRRLSSPGLDAGEAVWAEHRVVAPGAAARPCDCVHAFALGPRVLRAPFESDTYGEITGVARTRGRVLAADEFGAVVDVTPGGG